MNKMVNELFKNTAVMLVLAVLLIGKGSTANAADADCRQSNLTGTVNTINTISFGSSVAIPYAAAVGDVFATATWQAPSSGLNNPAAIIIQCRKPGDLRIRIVANGYDPTARGTPGFLRTLSPNVNLRFTLGTNTSDASRWMTTTAGNTFTIPNAIPDVADIGGGPLNPTLASANFTTQPAGTYNLTLARLMALIPITVTAELQKQATAGSVVNFGGYWRASMNLLFTNWGSANYNHLLAVFPLAATQSTSAPCDPLILSNTIVDLGTYPLKFFSAVGKVTNNVPIPITISCPGMISGGNVYYGFSTDYPDPSNIDLIGNVIGAGNATGVAVELMQSDGISRRTLLRSNDLTTNWTNSGITTSSKNASLLFYAHMLQTTATVTPGAVNAVATFQVNFR
ncbi:MULTISPECIES: fimbrial protein [Pseudomonas]|uniref:fimbrial protein n=1 Tax=Pseudomonas TaxID=286 RepID=UPI0015954711|nr:MULTISPECIES: fimbrial protein [unclassified Pseudomonas]MCV2228673.1 fimbrial protein [Pseudomonas sp. AU10]